MKYLLLGSSGLRVSEFCLGAMTFGEELGIGAPADVCREVFDGFLEAGGNFVDTADIYNAGTSERMLADFLRQERNYVVLASKYSLTTRPDDPNAGGSHRKNLVQSLEASLRRLGTDYLDLYWVHGWDRYTAMPEVLRALDDQVRAGKILHLGISNAPAWVVSAAATLAEERNWTPFTALQLHYNLVERSIEPDFLPLAAHFDMAVTAWSPLASGLLTGKYGHRASQDSGAAPDDGRLAGARGARTLTDRNLGVAAALVRMAAAIDCTPAQLALAWLRQRDNRQVIPIIGARNATQLNENLGALQLTLTAEQIGALDGLAPPPSSYPESLLAGEFFRTMMYGEVADEVRWPD